MEKCLRCGNDLTNLSYGWNNCPKCSMPVFIANGGEEPKSEAVRKMCKLFDFFDLLSAKIKEKINRFFDPTNTWR